MNRTDCAESYTFLALFTFWGFNHHHLSLAIDLMASTSIILLAPK